VRVEATYGWPDNARLSSDPRPVLDTGRESSHRGSMMTIDRMLNRIIDRWLRWEYKRDARRREQWTRRLHRDQRLGIW
jgi:hypothetical protein